MFEKFSKNQLISLGLVCGFLLAVILAVSLGRYMPSSLRSWVAGPETKKARPFEAKLEIPQSGRIIAINDGRYSLAGTGSNASSTVVWTDQTAVRLVKKKTREEMYGPCGKELDKYFEKMKIAATSTKPSKTRVSVNPDKAARSELSVISKKCEAYVKQKKSELAKERELAIKNKDVEKEKELTKQINALVMPFTMTDGTKDDLTIGKMVSASGVINEKREIKADVITINLDEQEETIK